MSFVKPTHLPGETKDSKFCGIGFRAARMAAIMEARSTAGAAGNLAGLAGSGSWS
jgi:hypothetical protein